MFRAPPSENQRSLPFHLARSCFAAIIGHVSSDGESATHPVVERIGCSMARCTASAAEGTLQAQLRGRALVPKQLQCYLDRYVRPLNFYHRLRRLKMRSGRGHRHLPQLTIAPIGNCGLRLPGVVPNCASEATTGVRPEMSRTSVDLRNPIELYLGTRNGFPGHVTYFAAHFIFLTGTFSEDMKRNQEESQSH